LKVNGVPEEGKFAWVGEFFFWGFDFSEENF
jgi:hypothetical protein